MSGWSGWSGAAMWCFATPFLSFRFLSPPSSPAPSPSPSLSHFLSSSLPLFLLLLRPQTPLLLFPVAHQAVPGCKNGLSSSPSHPQLELAILLGSRLRGLWIFLHIEPSQQHDGLPSKEATVAWIWWIWPRIGVDGEHTTCPTKALIATAVVHSPDMILAQSRGAHDARLNRDVEIGRGHDAGRMRGEELGDGNELGMLRAVPGFVGIIHARAHHTAVVNEHTAHGRLSSGQSLLGHFQRLLHEPLMY